MRKNTLNFNYFNSANSFLILLFLVTSIFAKDRSDLDYYPLNDGDYREYREYIRVDSLDPQINYFSTTVLYDTTLSNNLTYKKIVKIDLQNQNEPSEFTFERVDEESYNVYKFDIINNSEIIIDSLSIQIEDFAWTHRFDYPFVCCYNIESHNILGTQTIAKIIYRQPGINNGTYNEYYLAKNFGYIRHLWSDQSMPTNRYTIYNENLIYAIIDGVEYGEQFVGIENNNNELSVVNYKLSQNYPNPFNPTTKIDFELQNNTNLQSAAIVVYNAKGQQVWSSPVTRYGISPVTASILFNGSKLNSGIYYYSLVIDNKIVQTKSMVLIK